MEQKGKKFLVLYLTDWQKRMVKDFLNIECNTWRVPVNDPQLKYGIGLPTNPKVKKMYLTDWQIREMKQETGVYCEFVELEKRIVKTLYGLPPEQA